MIKDKCYKIETENGYKSIIKYDRLQDGYIYSSVLKDDGGTCRANVKICNFENLKFFVETDYDFDNLEPNEMIRGRVYDLTTKSGHYYTFKFDSITNGYILYTKMKGSKYINPNGVASLADVKTIKLSEYKFNYVTFSELKVGDLFYINSLKREEEKCRKVIFNGYLNYYLVLNTNNVLSIDDLNREVFPIE